jgi:hypothetical protein
VFALLAWFNTIRIRRDQRREQQRLDEKVRLRLSNREETRLIDLPGAMRRAEVTRAEVLGWIGMLPMKVKGKRYEIAYINEADFLDQLSQVQTGRGETLLRIYCSSQELAQFAKPSDS